jgi:hypothetical protein
MTMQMNKLDELDMPLQLSVEAERFFGGDGILEDLKKNISSFIQAVAAHEKNENQHSSFILLQSRWLKNGVSVIRFPTVRQRIT